MLRVERITHYNWLTLCRWACSLFLASVVSLILVLNELFTELNWFHISLAHARRVLSISPLRRSEAARSFWDLAMFSWVYLTHESGIVILWIIEVDDWYCIVKANGSTLLRHFLEFYFWVSLLPCIFISFLMDLGNNKVFGKPKTDKVTIFGWPKLYNAVIFGEPKLDKTSKIN